MSTELRILLIVLSSLVTVWLFQRCWRHRWVDLPDAKTVGLDVRTNELVTVTQQKQECTRCGKKRAISPPKL